MMFPKYSPLFLSILVLATGISAPHLTRAEEQAEPARPSAEAEVEAPDMARIEQAWRSGDFVTVRQGLQRLAQDPGTALAQYRYGRVLLEGRGGPQDLAGARDWLEKAAAQNHAEAAVLLARLYLSQGGEGEQAQALVERAAALLKSSAARGNSEAQYYLALLYQAGRGLSQDATEAFNWFLASAEQGYVAAAFELSRAYAEGRGSEVNTTEALRWLQAAAEAGHQEAQFYLAFALDSGRGVGKNRGEALNWLLRAAEGGFVQAQTALGRKYLRGDGAPQNPAEAERWLARAAEAGSLQALTTLGQALTGQEGIAADYPRAVTYLTAASQEGVAEASFDLGHLAEQGLSGPADLGQAVDYYRLAVAQGSAEAAVHLGNLAGAGRLEGLLAPHRAVPWALAAARAADTADAAEDNPPLAWLRQHAAQELRPAQTALALWLIEQQEDLPQAAELLGKAAEAGDPEAQYQLGLLYIKGLGVEQDYVAAHMWLNIAAASGQAEALKMREVAADLMVPEQIAEAQTAARRYFDQARAPEQN